MSYAGSIQPPEIAMRFALLGTWTLLYHYIYSLILYFCLKNINFSFALGNIPGISQTEQITLSKNVPDWSIWSSNYKSAGMRQKEKYDEEIRKKSSCEVFFLLLQVG